MVFWIAVVRAFFALALMVFGVEEPERAAATLEKPKPRFSDAWRLSRPFWAVVGVAVVLTLARFSEAFLVLRAQNVALAIALVPAVMVVMNIVYALSAYPAGVLSDRFGRQGVLIVGVSTLVFADLILATRLRKFTFAELEEIEDDLNKLSAWFAKIKTRDFFPDARIQKATEQFETCGTALTAFAEEVYAHEGVNAPIEC
ncbi:Chromate resistance protein ChrB, partial [Aerococcus mictus]|uniref:Chromate resistance protein ChrB n=1 Tax=Aerococcus mictus TaxID=2976810 RepID=UPI002FD0FBC1